MTILSTGVTSAALKIDREVTFLKQLLKADCNTLIYSLFTMVREHYLFQFNNHNHNTNRWNLVTCIYI